MGQEEQFSSPSAPDSFRTTREAILHFHARHFPAAPTPRLSHPSLGFTLSDGGKQNNKVGENEPVGNDQAYGQGSPTTLGFYDDGAPRTLTDEQIKIFRHTEIQELTRERRRAPPLEPGLSRPSESLTANFKAPGVSSSASPTEPKFNSDTRIKG